MNALLLAALVASLRRAFLESKWFNIAGVTDACRLLKLPIYADTQAWAVLQAFHCTHWKDMSPETYQELMRLVVVDVLGLAFDDVPEITRIELPQVVVGG